jgi:O-antigen/teichoic acid export membrane protein
MSEPSAENTAQLSWLQRRKTIGTHEKEEAKKYWATMGWHRPLAGFWFNYILILVVALPGLIILGVVIPMILPYPEALGFANVIMAYLMPIYLFADFGIKQAVERFISQHAEIQPRKAMRYVAFYIWYQCFTGLIQVTVISWFAITYISQTSMSYAVWLFLGFILIQWPGTPGIFVAALGGFQQFDKQNIIVIIQNVAIQSATQVGFILLGRYIGANNPEIGELIGATWGFIVGSYVDDLIAMIIGALLFKKVLKPFGIELKECLYTSFDKELAKEVMIYGGKVLLGGLTYVGVNALIISMLVMWLQNYPTWIGLYYLASGIIGALSISFSCIEPLSESFNNGKKDLTIYFIRQQFRWWGIISIGVFMIPILILIPSVVVVVAPTYSGIQWMVYPLFIGGLILFPSLFAGYICQACDLPGQAATMNIIEQSTRLLTYFLVLYPKCFGAWFGQDVVIYAWLAAEAPGYAAKALYGWVIIKKRLFPDMKIGFPWYQTLIAPALLTVPMIPIMFAMRAIFQAVYLVNEVAGFALAAIYIIALIYFIPICYIMPGYGFIGAWDNSGLEDFRKAALMSGPSRTVVKWLYNGTKWGHQRSPFSKIKEFSNMAIPGDIPVRQAEEITLLRHEAELKTKEAQTN